MINNFIFALKFSLTIIATMTIQRLDKFIKLRSEHQTFFFENYTIFNQPSDFKVVYNFRIDNSIEFHPEFSIPKKDFYHFENLNEAEIETLVFHIGMVELISYWKCCCPKDLVIKPFSLTKTQKIFWKKLYFNGLGEFFYTNGIEADYETFLNIHCQTDKEFTKVEFEFDDGTIIPVGGGKDSVVSLELLKSEKMHNLALIMNPRGASKSTASIGGYADNLIEIQRKIDKNLLELNARGYLNGHTPFSALLAFFTLLAAKISHKKFIALSNESSANEPTIPNTNVNHQYSKSLEFEDDFRTYVSENINSEVQYFSLLRPLSELQIAALFSKNQVYFDDFKSCNAGSKEDIWCGKCSKCLFAFIILSPFIQREKMEEIFAKNMLDDKNMLQYFNELTGIADEKPFECVGTVDEVNQALDLILKNYNQHNLPFLLQYYKDHKKIKTSKPDLKSLEIKHFLNKKYFNLVKSAVESL